MPLFNLSFDAKLSLLELRRYWVVTWSVPMLLLTIYVLLFGLSSNSRVLLTQMIIALFTALLIHPRMKLIFYMSVLFLGMSGFALGYQYYQTKFQWWQGEVSSSLKLDNSILKGSATANRSWFVPKGVDYVQLGFDGNFISEIEPLMWFKSQGTITIVPSVKTADAALITIPADLYDSHIARVYNLDSAATQYDFRVQANLSLVSPPRTISTQQAPRICFRTWSVNTSVWWKGHQGKCSPISLEENWVFVDLRFSAEQQADASYIGVTLDGFDGLQFELKDFTVQANDIMLSPSQVKLRAELDDETKVAAAYRFSQTNSLQRIDFRTESSSAEYAFFLSLAETVEIELTNTQLSSGSSILKELLPIPLLPASQRYTMFMAHSNLAGHSISMIALIALMTLSSIPLSQKVLWIHMIGFILIALTGLSLIYFTGSRTAWMTFVVLTAFVLALVLRGQLKTRVANLVFLSVLGFVLAMLFFLLQQGILGRIDLSLSEGGASRFEIFKAAILGFLQDPIRGGSLADFNLARVKHAHNFWLELALHYGLLGLMSALWLSFRFVLFAMKVNSWQAALLLLSLGFLNSFDYSFFYSLILLPVVFFLNAVAQEKRLSLGYD